MNIEWKPVVGWDNYEVSNLGRVRNVKTGKIKAASVNNWGYEYLNLSGHGKYLKTRVHCLVADAFIGRRPLGLDVNHKDGVKRNNSASNLEYVTRSENCIHAIRLGLAKASSLGNRKLNPEDVRFIRGVVGVIGCKRLAKQFGVSPDTIKAVRKGRSWKSLI